MYQSKLDTSAMAWSPTGRPGVWMKMLHQGETGGCFMGMTRLEAGSSIPAHRHTQADQMVYVVEGDLIDEETTYGPGAFLFVKAGTAHGPHSSSGGCVILTTYSGPPDFEPVG